MLLCVFDRFTSTDTGMNMIANHFFAIIVHLQMLSRQIVVKGVDFLIVFMYSDKVV